MILDTCDFYAIFEMIFYCKCLFYIDDLETFS